MARAHHRPHGTTNTGSTRTGGVATIVIAAAAVLAVGAFGVLSTSSSLLAMKTKPAKRLLLVPTAAEYKAALSRAGLDPLALTAAGVSAESISTVVGAAKTELASRIDALREADASFLTTKKQVDELQRAVSAGDSSQVEALTTAQTALAAAATSRQTVLAAVYAAGKATVSETQAGILDAIKAGRAGNWGLPLQHLAVTRSEADAVALRNALANVRIAGQTGREPDSTEAQLVSTACAVPAVAAAKTALDSSQSAVMAAWNTAIGQ